VNVTFTVPFILSYGGRTRTHLNATRTSVAAEGLTEENLYFLLFTKENANRVRPPAPIKARPRWGLAFIITGEHGLEPI